MYTLKNSKHLCQAQVFLTLVSILFCACKEKYLPEIKEVNVNYLVVEGLINTGTDSTIFTLSRTFKLNNKPIEAPEKGAIVQVESEGGATYVLPAMAKPGKYGRPSLGLDPTKKYRLRIRTTDKKEYLSDFVESKTSPPIDELRYEIKNNALNIYLDTYDPSGKSIYYKHSFDETWEYESLLRSLLKVENGATVPRKFPEDDITTCWRTLQSPNILLSSTNNLSEDRLDDRPIVSLPSTSEKLKIEYSILVKQTVLTRRGFEFYENLRKNTEGVGTIFDSQPSQLFGNIRSTTDSAETVIGFISAGSVAEKRFLIQLKDLPVEWFTEPDRSLCIESAKYTILAGEPYIWVWLPAPIEANARTPLIYCGDCRLLGGNKQRPTYWK